MAAKVRSCKTIKYQVNNTPSVSYTHLPDGIMTIVLPHGVLFRGGEEGEIRKNLIENNHIDGCV